MLFFSPMINVFYHARLLLWSILRSADYPARIMASRKSARRCVSADKRVAGQEIEHRIMLSPRQLGSHSMKRKHKRTPKTVPNDRLPHPPSRVRETKAS